MKNFDKKLNDFVRNLDNKSVFLDLDELKRKQSKIGLRLKTALKLSDKSIKQL